MFELRMKNTNLGFQLWVFYFAPEMCKAVNIAVESENWPYTIDM